MDWEVDLRESGTPGGERCREAGIGDDVAFATKPELARKMLERAVAAGVPFAWFTAGEAYGQNPGLRDWLEEQPISYVMAVAGNGPRAPTARQDPADALTALRPAGRPPL